MPRGNKIQSNSDRVNWTNRPHYQMHGGPKNRSGYGFKKGWTNTFFDKLQIVKIFSQASSKSNINFPGTTAQDVLLGDDQNDLGKWRFGKYGRGRWSDGLLHESWLRSRTDKFLLRGMHVGSEEDFANILKALQSIDDPDYAPDAPPELRKRYDEARKFFLEEGGLKVSVRRTITGGHWKPWKWRRGLRGTKLANPWRRDREATVASLARDRIREATIAAYAKTRSVEFAKHVKEQMLAALLEKKNGVRELDKLFQCAKDAQWVNGSWKERDAQQLTDKFRSEKRDAAPEFFKIHDAVVYGDPSKLHAVVKDGAKHALDIIDKAADPSYYQMHGDPQGQNRYRLKAGWARSKFGRAESVENYNTFLKEKKPDNFLDGTSNRGFFNGRWTGLKAETDRYLQQQMEVGTPADRRQIKKNLNGILSGALNRNPQNVSKQAKQDMDAFDFFVRQDGLKIRIGRTRRGGHWNPFKWRRGLSAKTHVNLYRTAREDDVVKAAEQRIAEATIAAYAKTGSLEFAKHVKEQMLAALLEKKMDGRPLDKLFKCAENATRENPMSWLPTESEHLRHTNIYDTEKRKAAPEFFNIYDAVTYGKPFELRKVAQNNLDDIKYDINNDIKYDDIILVNQDDKKYDINSSQLSSNRARNSFDLPDNDRNSVDLSDDMKSDDLKKSEVGSKDKDSVKEDISVANSKLKKSRASIVSRDNNSENIIVEEERNPKKEKNEPKRVARRESQEIDDEDEKADILHDPKKQVVTIGGEDGNQIKDNDPNTEIKIEDGNQKQTATYGDNDDSGSDTDSIDSYKDTKNAVGLDNRRQSEKMVDAKLDIGNNDEEKVKAVNPDAELKIADDNYDQFETIGDDGESGGGVDDSGSGSDMDTDSDTRSSNESIPDMNKLAKRKGEPPQVLEDVVLENNNNNNDDDDDNIPNAEEPEKDKDGD